MNDLHDRLLLFDVDGTLLVGGTLIDDLTRPRKDGLVVVPELANGQCCDVTRVSCARG